MEKIGLVTVLYKCDDVLEGFFKSLALQTYQHYILYIIDNSLNETTTRLLNQYFEQYPFLNCKHLPSTGNIGVAAGNNAGTYAALKDGCSHILLLNNDIEIEQEYLLERMMELSVTKNEQMIVPKILYYDTQKIWMAGGYLDKTRALGVHEGDGKESSAPAFNNPKYITYAPTCFMLIHKNVFERTGYMDEQYFAYYDDGDFVYRALEKGFNLFYEPSLIVLHKVSSSTGVNSPFYVYYSNRNKIYFIRKHFKGVGKWVSIGYTLLSRVAFYVGFDKTRKQKLLSALKDGFKMRIP